MEVNGDLVLFEVDALIGDAFRHPFVVFLMQFFSQPGVDFLFAELLRPEWFLVADVIHDLHRVLDKILGFLLPDFRGHLLLKSRLVELRYLGRRPIQAPGGPPRIRSSNKRKSRKRFMPKRPGAGELTTRPVKGPGITAQREIRAR